MYNQAIKNFMNFFFHIWYTKLNYFNETLKKTIKKIKIVKLHTKSHVFVVVNSKA